MAIRYSMVFWLLIWVSCCSPVLQDETFKKVEAWNPDQGDGEGFDRVSEMIKDLDLDRREETLVIGDVRNERLADCYRRIVRLEDGAFQSEKDGELMKFRMHPRLETRLKNSAGWGDDASFKAICVCLRKSPDGLPECVAVQFEGGPFFKVSNPSGRDRR